MKKVIMATIGLFAIALGAIFSTDLAAAVPHLLTYDGFITTAGIGGVFVMDPTRQRAIYERVKQEVMRLNNTAGANLICNEDYILTEQVLTSGNRQYRFDTWDKSMAAQRAAFPRLKGIKDNDLHIVSGIQLTIDNRTAASADVKPQTYPANFPFAAVTTTVLDLWAIFNASLNVTIDRVEWIPALFTGNFLWVPQTQKTGATNENEYSVRQSILDIDPYLFLSGISDNQITLNIPGSGAFGPDATTGQNVVTLYFETINVQGGAGYADQIKL